MCFLLKKITSFFTQKNESDNDDNKNDLFDMDIQQKRIRTISEFESDVYDNLQGSNTNVSINVSDIDDDENDPDTQGNEPIAVVDTNETQMSPRSRKKRDKEELDE